MPDKHSRSAAGTVALLDGLPFHRGFEALYSVPPTIESVAREGRALSIEPDVAIAAACSLRLAFAAHPAVDGKMDQVDPGCDRRDKWAFARAAPPCGFPLVLGVALAARFGRDGVALGPGQDSIPLLLSQPVVAVQAGGCADRALENASAFQVEPRVGRASRPTLAITVVPVVSFLVSSIPSGSQLVSLAYSQLAFSLFFLFFSRRIQGERKKDGTTLQTQRG